MDVPRGRKREKTQKKINHKQKRVHKNIARRHKQTHNNTPAREREKRERGNIDPRNLFGFFFFEKREIKKMDASERDALLDCERSYHGEDHLVSNPPASSSSSSSSFASRITTKSLVAGVAGMVLCAYSGHTVKRMLGAGQRGDAVRVFSFSIFFFFFGCRGFLMFA